jgi:hypothetical protein
MSEPETSPEKKPASVTVKLTEPIEFGKDTVIEELVVRPTARAFREFSLPMKEDGTVLYQPYALAAVGVKMAGQPNAIVDKLSVKDMSALAQVVMGFLS